MRNLIDLAALEASLRRWQRFEEWLCAALLGLLAGVLLTITCAGCIPPGVTVGSLGMRAQQGVPRGTSQPCISAPLSVCLAEAAVTATARAIGRQVPRAARGVGVCLIEQPESCCQGGWCVGPMNGGVAARKAGCSGSYLIVASRMWPPVCRASWEDEPHCVATAALQVDLGHTMLVHEAIKWTLDRFAMIGYEEKPRVTIDETKIQQEATGACAKAESPRQSDPARRR